MCSSDLDHRLDETGGGARTVGPSDRPEVIGVVMGDDDHVDLAKPVDLRPGRLRPRRLHRQQCGS